ncbi:TATA-binding protein-associated factor BTAF1-like isoform X3 [Vigna unguiculata]|nr:TATA-binding protein-associated factor BTAF1-like isoform X3 [Vigna unguiculata]
MALREILAHQGASAGVFKPDSPMGGTLFIELEDKSIPTTLKREREIDLNIVMNLLAEIYSQEDMAPNMYEVLRLGDKEMENGGGGSGDGDGEENPYVLSTLAQRLWPFMRHSITSVRYSAIRTLVVQLLMSCHEFSIFRRGYLKLDIKEACLSCLVLHSGPLLYLEIPLESYSRICYWKQMKIFCNVLREFGVSLFRNGDVDTCVTHTRVVTATALGYFASKLPVGSLKYVIDPLWSSLTSFSGVQRQVASMVLISLFKEIKLKNSSKNLDGLVPSKVGCWTVGYWAPFLCGEKAQNLRSPCLT